MRAYFIEGEAVGDRETLVRLAEEAGSTLLRCERPRDQKSPRRCAPMRATRRRWASAVCRSS